MKHPIAKRNTSDLEMFETFPIFAKAFIKEYYSRTLQTLTIWTRIQCIGCLQQHRRQ
jgi:hypothetical protein